MCEHTLPYLTTAQRGEPYLSARSELITSCMSPRFHSPLHPCRRSLRATGVASPSSAAARCSGGTTLSRNGEPGREPCERARASEMSVMVVPSSFSSAGGAAANAESAEEELALVPVLGRRRFPGAGACGDAGRVLAVPVLVLGRWRARGRGGAAAGRSTLERPASVESVDAERLARRAARRSVSGAAALCVCGSGRRWGCRSSARGLGGPAKTSSAGTRSPSVRRSLLSWRARSAAGEGGGGVGLGGAEAGAASRGGGGGECEGRAGLGFGGTGGWGRCGGVSGRGLRGRTLEVADCERASGGDFGDFVFGGSMTSGFGALGAWKPKVPYMDTGERGREGNVEREELMEPLDDVFDSDFGGLGDFEDEERDAKTDWARCVPRKERE